MSMKWRGEELLREACLDASAAPSEASPDSSSAASSTMTYTIVRPGQLVDGAARSVGAPRVGQCNASFMRGAASTRADVAGMPFASECRLIVAHSLLFLHITSTPISHVTHFYLFIPL
jgi:hypothetical protein